MRDGLNRLEPLELGRRRQSVGGSMADVLELSDPIRGLVTWMMRQGQCGVSDIAAYLEQDEDGARQLIDDLVDRGVVTRVEAADGKHYRARPAGRRQRRMPRNVLRTLDDLSEG